MYDAEQHIITRAIFESPETAIPQPVVQCVQIKPLTGQQGTADRFRVVFSDIQNFVQCMLATRMYLSTGSSRYFSAELANFLKEATHVIHDGKLKKGSVVRLKSFQANDVKGKKYISSSVDCPITNVP